MATNRVPVALHFDAESFVGRMRLIADAAHDLHAQETLARATWEPHDWRDL